ncbi:hypothetical protein EV194_1342, partial [Natronoflexus pectinivorans]
IVVISYCALCGKRWYLRKSGSPECSGLRYAPIRSPPTLERSRFRDESAFLCLWLNAKTQSRKVFLYFLYALYGNKNSVHLRVFSVSLRVTIIASTYIVSLIDRYLTTPRPNSQLTLLPSIKILCVLCG